MSSPPSAGRNYETALGSFWIHGCPEIANQVLLTVPLPPASEDGEFAAARLHLIESDRAFKKTRSQTHCRWRDLSPRGDRIPEDSPIHGASMISFYHAARR